MPNEDAIMAEDLRVRRGGAEILHGLSLHVAAGRVTGLLGPSGCGKTTLMRAIVGVQHDVRGRLRVLGRHAGEAVLRGRIGYMPQSPAVYGDLTVTENLRFFGSAVGARRSQVDDVITQVSLAPFAGRVVASLSGGQRARVSLAVALLGAPPLLILDEPTVGLDPLLRTELWNTFHALAAGGCTLLVSSHVMDEAAHCDELLLMREGDLLASGAPQELLRQTGERELESAFVALIRRAAPA